MGSNPPDGKNLTRRQRTEEAGYDDLTGAQWAEGEEQAREAVAAWVARVTA